MSCLIYPPSRQDSAHGDNDNAGANTGEEGRDEESPISFHRAATEMPELAAWTFSITVLLVLILSSASAPYRLSSGSLAVILFISGIILIMTSSLTSRIQSKLRLKDERVPLPRPTLYYSDFLGNRRALVRQIWKKGLPIMMLLWFRVELYEHIIKHTRCSSLSEVVLLPLMISLYEFWKFNWSKRKSSYEQGNSVWELVSQFCISTALFIAWLAIKPVQNGWKSSIICPIVTNERQVLLLLEILATIIDSAIVVMAEKLANMPIRQSSGPILPFTTKWGLILLGTTISWAIGKSGAYLLSTPNEEPLFSADIFSNFDMIILPSLLVSISIISASKWLQSTKAFSPLFVISMLATGYTLHSHIAPLPGYRPPVSFVAGILAAILFHSVAVLYGGHTLLVDYLRPFNRSGPVDLELALGSIYMIFSLSSLVSAILYIILGGENISGHPINALMVQGRQLHAQWLAEARYSIDLQGAVSEYTERYGLLPPPGFDVWYEYATNRSSPIIDNFDQIHQDLLPFRTLAPSTLRHLTNSMASSQWNDIATVVVRNGIAETQPGIIPTHRWMIEGIVQMITPFAQYLPDMDLAFNLNDECRVSVPWDRIQEINHTAKKNLSSRDYPMSHVWSKDRSLSWALSRSNDRLVHSHFTEKSRRDTFHTIVSESCPPSSAARTQYQWKHDTLCSKCAEPHSMGQFLQNWTLSGDICHQPDLADLHGFFIAPSAFKVSRKLLPVFSQSKVYGFNDILYPSAWNYMEKARYNPSDENPDPCYEDKENTIFWRGTTSEGFSEAGEWQGMARQRLLHLANNNTNPVSVLLPRRSEGIYSYYTFSPSAISQSIGAKVSIGIAEDVARCGAKDCSIQRRELGITNRVQFDEHWRHRFLFDLDGAGFSGRFLPFLQSNSLPFRTAIFRQWFDTRIMPWLHFVPQDIRFHDFWSTLGYFAGVRMVDEAGKVTKVLMKPHHRESRIIAREGRKWAEESLRKEDMEIYLFRLLLEWGRLTDDRRDELGFTG
ncbi:beta-1,2-xylosyltransferase [Trichophyton mentagrophytes]|nr:beta-1,2-xylosyltransferase [Trichophyton mentagrophytes]